VATGKDRVNNLTKHLEKNKSALSSKSVPDRRKNQETAYRDFLRREISRTQKTLENLKPVVK
jgi:hypothetical protein